MTDSTPRFRLPFILPGQAQKEAFHNEALLCVDAALHPSTGEGPRASPPAEPADGQCWIVSEGPSGAWADHPNELAIWTAGGWRFVAPVPGMAVWNGDLGLALRYDGSGWSNGEVAGTALLINGQQVVGARQPAVASPSGGTIIDEEARAAVSALVATLMSHGLIG
jgi:hypothetical protein